MAAQLNDAKHVLQELKVDKVLEYSDDIGALIFAAVYHLFCAFYIRTSTNLFVSTLTLSTLILRNKSSYFLNVA